MMYIALFPGRSHCQHSSMKYCIESLPVYNTAFDHFQYEYWKRSNAGGGNGLATRYLAMRYLGSVILPEDGEGVVLLANVYISVCGQCQETDAHACL